MLDVLEEFELAVSAFREDRCAKGFHDLLDGNGCACELVFCGTERGICGLVSGKMERMKNVDRPY